MPTTMAPLSTEQAPPLAPIDIEEDNIGNAGTMNINEEPLFVDELTQAAVAQARGRRVAKKPATTWSWRTK
jgi:hypothetical protein